jgi:hypothetical protein
VQVNRPIRAKERISSLHFDSAIVEITKNSSNQPKYKLTIPGTLNSSDSSLLIWSYGNITRIPVHENRFSIDLVSSKNTFFVFFDLIDKYGKYQRERVKFSILDEDESAPDAGLAKKRFSVSAGLAYSSVSYLETLNSSLQEQLVTGRVSFAYPLFDRRFELSASTFFTAFILNSTNPQSPARFLGINGRAGYVLVRNSSWSAVLNLGVYFTTMMVPDQSYGFRNLMGPQLYPTLTRIFGKSSVGLSLKFSPVSQGFSFLNLSNREIAIGGNYSYAATENMSFSGTFSWSQLKFYLDPVQVQLNTWSLGSEILLRLF